MRPHTGDFLQQQFATLTALQQGANAPRTVSAGLDQSRSQAPRASRVGVKPNASIASSLPASPGSIASQSFSAEAAVGSPTTASPNSYRTMSFEARQQLRADRAGVADGVGGDVARGSSRMVHGPRNLR